MSLNNFLKSSLISNLNSNIPKRFYTVIVERIKKPPIPKKGVDPRRINLKSVNYQYRFVECKHNKSWGNVDLILTQYVEGVGHKGEIVSIPRMQAYYELLPARLAVYPTQEYLEMYAEDRKALSTKSKVSPFAMKTKEELSKLLLEIPMNTEAEWTLNEEYIRLALRYNRVMCDSKCVKIPEGLNINSKDPKSYQEPFFVEIKINDYISTQLKCKIVPLNLNKLWENFSVFNKRL